MYSLNEVHGHGVTFIFVSNIYISVKHLYSKTTYQQLDVLNEYELKNTSKQTNSIATPHYSTFIEPTEFL